MDLVRLFEVGGHLGEQLVRTYANVYGKSQLGVNLVLKPRRNFHGILLVEPEAHVDEAFVNRELLKHWGVASADVHKPVRALLVPRPVSADYDKVGVGAQRHADWLGGLDPEFLCRHRGSCDYAPAVGGVTGHNRRDEPDVRPAFRQKLYRAPTEERGVYIYMKNCPSPHDFSGLTQSDTLKELEVRTLGLEFTVLDAVDDFHHLVVARSRHADLASLCAYGPIDGIHFGLLATLDVLEHACLEKGVLLYSERNDEEGDGFL